MGRLPKGEGLHRGNDHNKLGPVLGCAAVAVFAAGSMFPNGYPEEPHGIPPATPATTSSEQSASVPSQFPVRPERKAEIDEKAKIYYKKNTGGDILELTRTLALIRMDLWLVILILKTENT